ncbi:hypothetical protein VTL71DRAFT_8607 [Oculimacula yallundae]|uniref:C2H2-type domain-containing protein n=1 Tax=Oculimacula yallundae TaxID=86028 RepID=A0ABR4CZL5_9HELO
MKAIIYSVHLSPGRSMNDQHRDKKRKLSSGEEGDEQGETRPMKIRWKRPKAGSKGIPFEEPYEQHSLPQITTPMILPEALEVPERPEAPEAFESPESTEAPERPEAMKTQPGDFKCQYCDATFGNKDLLLGHKMRTPHGFNDEGRIVAVSSGFGLDHQAKIITPPEGYYVDEYSDIVKIPKRTAVANPRAQTGPPVINPDPFFEPGCPDTGVFLPVGTPGYLHPTKQHTLWFCPWEGCGKRNWKLWRVNRHINTTHVAKRKSYFICSCGQAYATKAEEEAHRVLTGHEKAI